MLKIAVVSCDASPLAALDDLGAGERNVHIAELSAALARLGHDVSIYTRRDNPGLPERVTTTRGYTVVQVPAGPPRTLPAADLLSHMGPFARYLDEQWRNERPDVAHAHSWLSGIPTQLAARHLNVPAVQTFHGLGVVERRFQGAQDAVPRERITMEAMLARTATWVAATSSDEVSEVTRLGRSRNRISVVPSGVDLDVFTPDGPKAPRARRHRIMSVGKFAPRRGFDVMVRSLPAIPDAELVLVGGPGRDDAGSDPDARRLRALAKRLGVADRLVLHGPAVRPDLPALLRSADVVACTPLYEPFGIVALEAMACGVPVVATAVGGMLDTVVDEVTGRLVTPGRPVEIAEVVNHLLHDLFLRQSLGAAGRDRARARYSWDRVAADTGRIYGRLAAEHEEQPAAAARVS